MTNSELKQRLTAAIALLTVPGIGRSRYNKLVRQFGSPQAVFDAGLDNISDINGLSRSLASNIKRECDFEKASQIASRIVQLGWTVLFPDAANYPDQLKEIPVFPPLLFCQGDELQSDDKLIAIVGTRHPSESGKQFTYNLAATLANEGIIIVSGMAEGIDSAAHKGALGAGGKTVAVWGSSLDVIYPASNRLLADKIKNQGTIFSEYMPETRPDKAYFPERNRIISGLSSGTVVVEAGGKSGALITATHAIDQNRELFAVPGSPESPRSIGVNKLIKQGARLLTSVEDIFDELPQLKNEVLVKKFKKLPDLTEKERTIINLFSEGPLQIDQISRSISLPVAELMEFLLAMELKGVVKELAGKRFILSEDYQ